MLLTRTGAAALIAASLAVAPGAVLQAQNILVNGDFDGSEVPWTALSGALAWEALDDADACAASGSGRLTSTGFDAVAGQSCFAVSPGEQFFAYAMVKRIAGTSIGADVYLCFHSSANCSGSPSCVGNALALPLGTWAPVESAAVVPAAMNSLQVSVQGFQSCCVGGVEFLVDSVYAGTADRVFEDAFENGEFCRWSSTVPP